MRLEDIFGTSARYLPSKYLCNVVEDHIYSSRDFVCVATDGSVVNEKSGIGILSPLLHFTYTVRLPNYTPIFETEFIAIILALQKVPSGYTKVLVLTDSRSVCDAMGDGCKSSYYRKFCSLVPDHIAEVALTWIPGHSGIAMNEAADHFDSTSLFTPETNLLLSIPLFARARSRRFSTQLLITPNSITGHTDFI